VVGARRAAKRSSEPQEEREARPTTRRAAEDRIRVLRSKPVFTSRIRAASQVGEEREPLVDQHVSLASRILGAAPFYDQMCKRGGDPSTSRRQRDGRQERPRRAVTGGRSEIGYQAGIKLMRAGVADRGTTLFRAKPAALFQESGLPEGGDRLESLRLDLRQQAERRNFCHPPADLARPALDLSSSNACQTVAPTPRFYAT